MSILTTDEAYSSKVSRLENRLKILEDKIHHDSREFREDLAKVLDILNGSFTGNLDVPSEDTRTNLVNNNMTCTLQRLETSFSQDIAAMKRGFSEEKMRLKQYVNILELSLKRLQEGVAKDFDLFAKGIDDVRSDLSDYCKEQSVEIKGVSERLESIIETKIASKLEKIDETLQQTNRVAFQIQLDIGNVTETVDNIQSKVTHPPSSAKCNATAEIPTKKTLKSGWTQFENSYYYINNEARTWEDAKIYCETENAYLAEVNSEAEHLYLASLSGASTSSSWGYRWLGGSDIEKEGHWTWSHSHSEVTVTFWNLKPSEPNGGRSENCLHMFSVSDGTKWNDVPCYFRFGFICEMSMF